MATTKKVTGGRPPIFSISLLGLRISLNSRRQVVMLVMAVISLCVGVLPMSAGAAPASASAPAGLYGPSPVQVSVNVAPLAGPTVAPGTPLSVTVQYQLDTGGGDLLAGTTTGTALAPVNSPNYQWEPPLPWDLSWLAQWPMYLIYMAIAKAVWVPIGALLGTCRFLLFFRNVLVNLAANFIGDLFQAFAPFYLAMVGIAIMLMCALIFARWATQFQISSVERIAIVVVLVVVLTGSGPVVITGFDAIRGFFARASYTLAFAGFGGTTSPSWCSISQIEPEGDVCSGYEIAMGYIGVTNEAELTNHLPDQFMRDFYYYNGQPISSSWFASQPKPVRDQVLDRAWNGIPHLLWSIGLIFRALMEEIVWTLLSFATLASFVALAFALIFASFLPAGDLLGDIFRMMIRLFMTSGWTGVLMGIIMGFTMRWLDNPMGNLLNIVGLSIFAMFLYSYLAKQAASLAVESVNMIANGIVAGVIKDAVGTTVTVAGTTAAVGLGVAGGALLGPAGAAAGFNAGMSATQAANAGIRSSFTPSFTGTSGPSTTITRRGGAALPAPEDEEEGALSGVASAAVEDVGAAAGGALVAASTGAAGAGAGAGASTGAGTARPATPPADSGTVRRTTTTATAVRATTRRAIPPASPTTGTPAGAAASGTASGPRAGAPAQPVLVSPGASGSGSGSGAAAPGMGPDWQQAASAALNTSGNPAQAWKQHMPLPPGVSDETLNRMIYKARVGYLEPDELDDVLDHVSRGEDDEAARILTQASRYHNGQPRLTDEQAQDFIDDAATIMRPVQPMTADQLQPALDQYREALRQQGMATATANARAEALQRQLEMLTRNQRQMEEHIRALEAKMQQPGGLGADDFFALQALNLVSPTAARAYTAARMAQRIGGSRPAAAPVYAAAAPLPGASGPSSDGSISIRGTRITGGERLPGTSAVASTPAAAPMPPTPVSPAASGASGPTLGGLGGTDRTDDSTGGIMPDGAVAAASRGSADSVEDAGDAGESHVA